MLRFNSPNDEQIDKNEITAICVSPNRRHCAIAEKGNGRAKLRIYDLQTKKKRQLVPTGIVCSSYVSLCFSPDSRELLTLGKVGESEYYMINWQATAKPRPLQTHHFEKVPQALTQCSISPFDPNQVCVSGRGGTALFFEMEDHNTFRQLPYSTLTQAVSSLSTDYVCHTWLPGRRVVLGTNRGSLALFKDGIYQYNIEIPHSSVEDAAITALVPTTKGLIAGSAAGYVVYFNIESRVISTSSPGQMIDPSAGGLVGTVGVGGTGPSAVSVAAAAAAAAATNPAGAASGASGNSAGSTISPNFELETTFTLDRVDCVDSADGVVGLAISSEEEVLVVGTEHGQLYKLDDPLNNVVGTLGPMDLPGNDPSSSLIPSSPSNAAVAAAAAAAARSEPRKYDYLICPFHSGPISGLDTCVRKQIIATCGLRDRTVRIWRYLDRTTELTVKLDEAPLALALHPSGLFLLIAFAEKLKLCSITYDSLRPYKEFPIRGCTEVAFSHGGHMFAAAAGSSLYVYSTYTCEPVTGFVTRASNTHAGAIKTLSWSPFDTAIVTGAADGTVFERRLERSLSVAGSAPPGDVLSSKNSPVTAATLTADGKLYFASDGHGLNETTGKTLQKTLEMPTLTITQLVVNQPPERMMFAATGKGFVRSLRYPLTGEVRDYHAHCGAITRMRLSRDATHLFTAGDDGCIVVFSVQEMVARAAQNFPISDDVLVKQQDLEEQLTQMQELEAKLEELKDTKEYTLRSKEVAHEDSLKRISEEYTLRLDHDRAQIQMLREDKQATEADLQEHLMITAQRYEAYRAAQAQEYQKKLMMEMHKLQTLQEELERCRSEHELEMRQLQERHERELATRKAQLDKELLMQQRRCEDAKERLRLEGKTQAEFLAQMGEDMDAEVEMLRQKFEGALEIERETAHRLKGEKSFLQKKAASIKKDIETTCEEKDAEVHAERALKQKVVKLKQALAAQKAEISSLDEVIAEKERQIYALKKDNQKLEKHKFVLDHKIKDLKRQIEPRELEIADMRARVAKLDTSLEVFHKDNARQEEIISRTRQALVSKLRAVVAVRAQCRKAYREAEAMCIDTAAAVAKLHSKEEFLEAVRQLRQKYATTGGYTAKTDARVTREYARHRIFLQKAYRVANHRMARDAKARSNDNMRIMQENVGLIKEINSLRRQIKLINQARRQRDMASNRPHSSSSSSNVEESNASKLASLASGTSGDVAGFNEAEARRILEVQKTQIRHLRALIEEKQNALVRVTASLNV